MPVVGFSTGDFGCPVTSDELKIFHGVDRALYSILIKDLLRNPFESLQIMGLWLWLERGGSFTNVITMIISLPVLLVNELADEAVTCLNCIKNRFPLADSLEIPVTRSLVENNLFLLLLQENAYDEVKKLISKVCIPALSDIMERALRGGFGSSGRSSTHKPIPIQGFASSSTYQVGQSSSPPDISLIQNLSSLNLGGDASTSRVRPRTNDVSRHERTMFVTFSKGYPVSENEVRTFFTRQLGNCIESMRMQAVEAGEQALYARIVFVRSNFIESILKGQRKAKFTINGKHVWVRKFVPRNGSLLPCGCPSVGPSTCPHNE